MANCFNSTGSTGTTYPDIKDTSSDGYVGVGNITIGSNAIQPTSTGTYGEFLNFLTVNGSNLLRLNSNGDLQFMNSNSITGLNNLSCQTAAINTLSAGIVKIDGSHNMTTGSTTTSDLTEGSNLYFTNARALSALSNYEYIQTLSGSNKSVVLTTNINSYTTDLRNVMVGKAGKTAMTSTRCVLLGIDCGTNITSGSYNIFIGDSCGQGITTGQQNVFIGANISLNNNVSSSVIVGNSGCYGNNVAVLGASAGYNSTADNTTYFGSGAGLANTSGTGALFMGMNAGYGTGTAAIGSNTCVGYSTLRNVNSSSAVNNTTLGALALYNCQSSANNTAIGCGALQTNSTGSGNVCVGYNAGQSETGSNKLYISNSSTSSPLIYGDFSSQTLTVNNNLTVASNLTASGNTQMTGFAGIGIAPATDRRLYVSGGQNSSSEVYNTYIANYPIRTTGTTSYTGLYNYANWVNLSGGNLNYIAMDVGSTSGSNANVASSIGIYCRNPGASTTSANNVAIYADDISVGNTSNKIANGIYCSSDLKCGGNLYNGSYSTSTAFYTTSSATATITFTGGASVNPTITYCKIGRVCTVNIPTITATISTATMPSFYAAIPSGFYPGANQGFTCWLNNGTNYIDSLLRVDSTGKLIFFYGNGSTSANWPIGTYVVFSDSLNFSYII